METSEKGFKGTKSSSVWLMERLKQQNCDSSAWGWGT
jgi:hypothetical protein